MVIENINLVCEECANCHLLFWISEKQNKRLIKSKETFYCPNGHAQSYAGETNKQKIEKLEKDNKQLRDSWEKTCETSSKYYDKWQKAEKELKKLKPKKKVKGGKK